MYLREHDEMRRGTCRGCALPDPASTAKNLQWTSMASTRRRAHGARTNTARAEHDEGVVVGDRQDLA